MLGWLKKAFVKRLLSALAGAGYPGISADVHTQVLCKYRDIKRPCPTWTGGESLQQGYPCWSFSRSCQVRDQFSLWDYLIAGEDQVFLSWQGPLCGWTFAACDCWLLHHQTVPWVRRGCWAKPANIERFHMMKGAADGTEGTCCPVTSSACVFQVAHQAPSAFRSSERDDLICVASLPPYFLPNLPRALADPCLAEDFIVDWAAYLCICISGRKHANKCWNSATREAAGISADRYSFFFFLMRLTSKINS